MLTKEDIVLALMTLVADIRSEGAENHFSLRGLDHAEEVIKLSGWDIVTEITGDIHYVKRMIKDS